MRILFTGGGTGGHLFPIVAVHRSLKVKAQKKGIELQAFFLGPNHFSPQVLEPEGIKCFHLITGKLRRYFSWRHIIDLPKVLIGFIQALWCLWRIMPDCVWAKGGYGTFGPVIASFFYGIPIIIHESDSIPGLTNRLLSFFAKRVGVSFQEAFSYFPQEKTALVGNPIRKELLTGNIREAQELFGLQGKRPVLLILGGSQGAQKINTLIAESLPKLLSKYEIIHQCGSQNLKTFRETLKNVYNINIEDQPYYHLKGFLNEKEESQAYAVADLVISRAGSGTIFEIAACGKPCILIPLPKAASDHQHKNAFEYARSGAAVVLEQANLTPHLLEAEIRHILETPGLAQKMSKAALNFAQPEAANIIAEEILKLAFKK